MPDAASVALEVSEGGSEVQASPSRSGPASAEELSSVPLAHEAVALEVSEGDSTVQAAGDSSPSRSGQASVEEEAATRLQALYRGVAVRRRLQAQADGRAAAAAHGEQAAAWFQALHRVATTRTHSSIDQHPAIQEAAARAASSKEEGAGVQHEEAATKLEEDAATKLEADAATKLEEDAATKLEEDAATKLDEDVATELEEDAATKLEQDAATKLEEHAAMRIQAFRRGSAARRRLQRQRTVVFTATAGGDSAERSGEVFTALGEEGCEEGNEESSRPHGNEFLGRAATEGAPEEERSQVVEAEAAGSTSQEAEVVVAQALVVALPSGEPPGGLVAAAEEAEASAADSLDEFEESDVDSSEPVPQLARVDVGVTEESARKLGTEMFGMSEALKASCKLEPEAREADSGDDPFEDSTEAPGEEQLATLGSGVELAAGEADWADDALEDEAVQPAASGHQAEHEASQADQETGFADDTFEESTETHGNEFSEPADAEEDYGDDFEDDAFEEEEEEEEDEEEDEEDTSCTEAS